jgi:hypothetical protein
MCGVLKALRTVRTGKSLSHICGCFLIGPRQDTRNTAVTSLRSVPIQHKDTLSGDKAVRVSIKDIQTRVLGFKQPGITRQGCTAFRVQLNFGK